MAKQHVKITKKVTTTRRKKSNGGSGYKTCNMCHGTGKVKK